MVTPVSCSFESVIAASKQLPYEVQLEGGAFFYNDREAFHPFLI